MKIGIIDADVLDNGTRHPNLACEKMSGFYKGQGHDVKLITDYSTIAEYDKVFMSCVFDFTQIPLEGFEGNHDHPDMERISKLYPNLNIGGTGFFWKDAPDLPYEIEHHMPDYHLYDEFIGSEIARGIKPIKFNDYVNYSIGFTTRGCFRKCAFCVNEKYDRVHFHAPVSEFLDKSRKYIYLWDDNILAYGKWESVFDELNATGKPFQFRQGMDMRLMTERKAKVLSESRYHGDYIFAFDHIEDRDLIEEKLKIWQRYSSKVAKLYVLCGFDSQDEVDIVNTFERIRILMKHHCLPYIMRHEYYLKSKYRGLYVTLARWCNQPSFFKKKSFREYCEANQAYHKNPNTLCSALATMREFEREHPDIAAKYFDLKWDDYGDSVGEDYTEEAFADERKWKDDWQMDGLAENYVHEVDGKVQG